MKLPFISLVIFLFACNAAFSQAANRKAQFNLNGSSVAISGYDAVAYFTQQKAIKGNKNYAVNAEGVIYYFSSQGNKDLFLKNWKSYEPQYGGWCAYAMGNSGEKVEIDPETFKIADGKLYLFYHSWTNNTLLKWNKEEVTLKQKADLNWVKLFH